jgi:hypothetical protein
VLFAGLELVLLVLARLQLVAQRPAWEVGAKAALSLKRPAQASTQQAAAPPAAPPAASAWKISGGDEDELLDDEQLLTEEDRARPAAPAGTVVMPAYLHITSQQQAAHCCSHEHGPRASREINGCQLLTILQLHTSTEQVCLSVCNSRSVDSQDMATTLLSLLLLIAVSASDCSTSKKACANCSCGRAEREAAGEKVSKGTVPHTWCMRACCCTSRLWLGAGKQ